MVFYLCWKERKNQKPLDGMSPRKPERSEYKSESTMSPRDSPKDDGGRRYNPTTPLKLHTKG